MKITEVNEIQQITKSDIKQSVQSIEQSIIDGDVSGLDVKIKAAMIKAVYEALNKSEIIRNSSVIEGEKYGKDERTRLGCAFEVSETGVKYDYTNSNAWVYYQQQIEKAKMMQKVVETTAKNMLLSNSVVGSQPYVEPETGELLEILKPIKTSTTNLKVSLK